MLRLPFRVSLRVLGEKKRDFPAVMLMLGEPSERIMALLPRTFLSSSIVLP